MTTSRDSSLKRVFFHVGAPKTGTTYLQNVLFQNRDELAARGVLYPYEDRGQSFRSMQDFRGAGWGGGRADEFAGEWDRVAASSREWQGSTVIVSNELLGGASPERIARGLASVQPAEIHVVFSARDFARQLVSDWQEHVKHKHTITLETFVDDLVRLGLDAPAPFGELFWGMHDVAHVLRRWEQHVTPAHIHIVTVAPAGAPPDTLWRRFCAVTGLEPERYGTDTRRANASMGVAETELVRRMNFEVQGMAADAYDPLGRRLLAEDILGGRSAKLMLPPSYLPWVSDRSRQLIDELESAGYDVEGDLEELMPQPEGHAAYVSPTDQTEADLADAAIRAATGLLKQAGRQRRRNAELQQALQGSNTIEKRGGMRAGLREVYWKTRGSVGRLVRGRQRGG
ncbi:MAG: hypothetical protein ACR2LE_01400 [Nocardioidaceae bacterium]